MWFCVQIVVGPVQWVGMIFLIWCILSASQKESPCCSLTAWSRSKLLDSCFCGQYWVLIQNRSHWFIQYAYSFHDLTDFKAPDGLRHIRDSFFSFGAGTSMGWSKRFTSLVIEWSQWYFLNHLVPLALFGRSSLWCLSRFSMVSVTFF